MREDGVWRRPLAWLRNRAPGLHGFLTSHERGAAVTREVLGGVMVILLLVTLLWGTTGQPLTRSPVVVVESESMMRCDGALHGQVDPSECQGPFGRLGTIDAGDLIFVHDVNGRGDVVTFLECLEAGHRERYGDCGDTIIYRRGGSNAAPPVIHRAMFWLEIHGNDRYSVPECDVERVDGAQLASDPCVARALTPANRNFISSTDGHPCVCDLGPEHSGFITLGDNNIKVDQPGLTPPVQPEWILGKARGELPWLGLIKLWVSDVANGCGPGGVDCHYRQAPGDVKAMMWLTLAVLIGGPVVLESVLKRRRDFGED